MSRPIEREIERNTAQTAREVSENPSNPDGRTRFFSSLVRPAECSGEVNYISSHKSARNRTSLVASIV